jgi:SAM-dependent methyltransferase
MSVFDDSKLFGRLWADTYDETSSPDPTAAVEFLAGLAGDGPVLELAIGTGRVALPLAARGLTVEGIEASPEMIAGMRAKPGGEAIPVVVGDMADVDVAGSYPLIYLVYNTLFNLTGDGRQEDCFRNVARVLAPGGVFVIEAYVPGIEESEGERNVEVRSVTEDSVELRMCRYNYEAQTFIRQTVIITDGSIQLKPFSLHYRWPEQIDALATEAGLQLENRYANWKREPFGPASTDHVSIYRKPRLPAARGV